MTEPGFASYPSLRDRVAFVSGGASGLGEEFVRQLAAQHAKVAFVDIDQARGLALERELTGDGLTVGFTAVDVRDVPALQGAITATAQAWGPVRVLVNNAADDTRRSSIGLDVATWDDSLAVNVRHHFFAAAAVAPMMAAAGGGSIINLGSISAHIDLVELATYVTAKAGIEGLTRELAREWGPSGIRVNCVIPGWIMTAKQLELWITPEAEASIARNQCLPRTLVPADVARMVLWLAADDSSGCTAQKWIVDGGWM